MSKKTKVAILILVIALIIVLAIGTISIINSFKPSKEDLLKNKKTR